MYGPTSFGYFILGLSIGEHNNHFWDRTTSGTLKTIVQRKLQCLTGVCGTTNEFDPLQSPFQLKKVKR